MTHEAGAIYGFVLQMREVEGHGSGKDTPLVGAGAGSLSDSEP